MYVHPVLDKLCDQAYKKLGVEYDIRWEFSSGKDHAPQGIYFSCFRRLQSSRFDTKGNGAVALYTLLRAADYLKKKVVLWTDVPKLYEWYESFGFYCVEEYGYGKRVRTYVYDPRD